MSSAIAPRLHAALVAGVTAARYLDRYYRDGFDRVVRPAVVELVQAVIRHRLPRQPAVLAEERELEGEAAATQAIIDTMATFARRTYSHATSERIGNTKTYGVVHGEFEVAGDLPERLKHGVFAQARTFPAWVRFGGPGPLAPPDPRDNGILSVGIKLMDVPGPKLLDDEQRTQDFTGISSPTFTTPDVVENVKLQRRLLQGLPAFYFVDPRDSHLLDAAMQGLYSRMNTSPLEVSYWSCVPYLLGEGQAMRYAIHPRAKQRTRLPARPPANYLRQAMARTLAERPVEFDVKVQLQADPQRMPIENASVIWSERRSPPVTVARLRLPVQQFDSPEQHAFARTLSFQPWHSVYDHRPARQPESSAAPDLLRALEAAAGDERRRARRARRQRTVPIAGADAHPLEPRRATWQPRSSIEASRRMASPSMWPRRDRRTRRRSSAFTGSRRAGWYGAE
jgi:hypothetical protein